MAVLSSINVLFDKFDCFDIRDFDSLYGKVIIEDDGFVEGIVKKESETNNDSLLFGFIKENIISLIELSTSSNPYLYKGKKEDKSYSGEFIYTGINDNISNGRAKIYLGNIKDKDSEKEIEELKESILSLKEKCNLDLYNNISSKRGNDNFNNYSSLFREIIENSNEKYLGFDYNLKRLVLCPLEDDLR